MANKYAINTGALTWTGSSWNTASNQATSNTTAPTSADVAYLDQYSSNMTINATTCVCKELLCTGYTKTLTYTSGQTLTVGSSGSGVVIYPSGVGGTVAGTGTLALATGATTVTSNGKVMTGNLTSTACAITLSGDLQVNGTFNYTGASQINGAKLKFNGSTWTIGSKATLSGTGTVEFLSALTIPPSYAINVIFNSGANTLTFPASTAFSKQVTYTSGTLNLATNNNLSTFSTGSSVNTSGITFLNASFSGTVTMLSNFTCTNFYFGNSATIVGAYTFTCDKFRVGSNATFNFTSSVAYIFDTAMTFVISTYLYLYGNLPFTISFSSSSVGTPTTWTYNGTSTNYQLANCVFTDVSLSSGRLYALNSPVTRSTNILQIRNSDIQGVGTISI